MLNPCVLSFASSCKAKHIFFKLLFKEKTVVLHLCKRPCVTPMKRSQACIYKDFTWIHQFLWVQVYLKHLFSQGNFTKILCKSIRLAFTSEFIQVILQIKYWTFGKKNFILHSESLCETYANLMNYWLHLYEATFTLILFQ